MELEKLYTLEKKKEDFKNNESGVEVLKKTYRLLALTMIPTIGGAFFGSIIGHSGLIASIIFLVISLGLIFMIQSNAHNKKGLYYLYGFNFMTGLLLSTQLTSFMYSASGTLSLLLGIACTGGFFYLTSAYAFNNKVDTEKMEKPLIYGLLGLLIYFLLSIVFGFSLSSILINGFILVLFGGFMIYDTRRILDGDEKSPISATLSLYLNMINIFNVFD